MTDDVVQYLLSKQLAVHTSANLNVHTHCPFHGEDPTDRGRLYVNVDSGSDKYGYFICFVCGVTGGFNKLRQHFGDQPVSSAEPKLNRNILNAAADYYQQQLLTNQTAYDYLRFKRGLTAETIRDAKLGWADGGLVTHLVGKGFDTEDIKSTGLVNQFGEDFLSDKITIPYLDMGQVVQIRGKDINGKYLTPPGQKSCLFGVDSLLESDTIIVAEGECFPPEAEVFTPDGWVRFDELDQTELVCQVNDEMVAEFVKPSAYIKKPFSGMLSQRSNRQRFFSLTTPGHNMVYRTKSGLVKKPAEETAAVGSIPRSVLLNGPGVDASNDDIMLALAVSADGTIDVRKSSGRYCRFGFAKQRKIDRLTALLARLEIKFSCNIMPSNGQTSICFWLPERYNDPDSDIYISKVFNPRWIAGFSIEQRIFFLEEMVLWDGNRVPNRKQVEFSSKHYSQVLFVQTIAHTAGFVSTIMHRTNKYGEWYKVSVLLTKSSTDTQSVRYAKKIPYEGDVYCVTVKSGMILVRQGGCISVTGNCDELVLRQLGYAAVGVPGANNWQKQWTELFDAVKRVYICFDNDPAGKAGADKLATVLGAKAKIVTLPSLAGESVDVTEYIVDRNNQKSDFDLLLRKATGGLLVSVTEAFERWQEIEGNPNRVGLRFNIKSLDDTMRNGLTPGQVIITIGKTGSSKSLTCFNLLHRMSLLKPDLNVLMFSLEQTRNEWFERARRIHSFYDPTVDNLATVNYWNDRMFIVDKNRLSEDDLKQCIDQFDYEMGKLPDIVVVDYLGYYARSYRGDDYERVSSAVMGLKSVAKETNAVIYAPHQVNRTAGFGQRLQADMARSSGVVEETADMLMSIINLDQGIVDPAERRGEVQLEVLKARDAGTGHVVTMQFAPLTLAMVPSSDPDFLRAKQERQWMLAGESWESAVARYRTGNNNPMADPLASLAGLASANSATPAASPAPTNTVV